MGRYDRAGTRPRDAGHVPFGVGQVLIYPVIDPTLDTPSYRAYASGFVNTLGAMQWYWEQYLGGSSLPSPAYLVAPR